VGVPARPAPPLRAPPREYVVSVADVSGPRPLRQVPHSRTIISLYERMGFRVQGRRRHSIRINGTFVDDPLMA